jgi:Domain of unknown function (DUF4440)
MKLRFLLLAAAALIAATAALPLGINAQQAPPLPPLVAQFQKIEDDWSAAVVKQDQYTLETILSPTFVDLSSTGEITTRDQQVAAMFEKGVPQAVTMEQRVVNVRVIEDVAIVDGTYIERIKLNGVQREERGLFSHVYQHVRQMWVCVQSQRTAIVEQGDERKRSKKEKSDAELPFHIPILHKGAESTQQPTSSQPTPQF